MKELLVTTEIHISNSEIRNLINEKNVAYKSYYRFNRDKFFFRKV